MRVCNKRKNKQVIGMWNEEIFTQLLMPTDFLDLFFWLFLG